MSHISHIISFVRYHLYSTTIEVPAGAGISQVFENR
jgi:hypothetical protein